MIWFLSGCIPDCAEDPGGSQSRSWQQLQALHTLPGNRPLELSTQEENKSTKHPAGEGVGGRGGGGTPSDLPTSRTVESGPFSQDQDVWKSSWTVKRSF